MTDKEIIQALRCTSTPGGPQEDCTGCTYYRKEQLDAELKEKLGVDTWPSCDVNKVGMDAADIIERLTAENAALWEKCRSGSAWMTGAQSLERASLLRTAYLLEKHTEQALIRGADMMALQCGTASAA